VRRLIQPFSPKGRFDFYKISDSFVSAHHYNGSFLVLPAGSLSGHLWDTKTQEGDENRIELKLGAKGKCLKPKNLAEREGFEPSIQVLARITV
jgi:hypothetical protein